MDPTITLQILRDPTNHLDERLDAARDLRDWLQRCGHAPDGEDRRELLAEVRRLLDANDAADTHLEGAYDDRYELGEDDR